MEDLTKTETGEDGDPPPDTVVGSLIAESFRANGLGVPRANVVTLAIQLNSALVAKGPYLATWPGSMLHFNAERFGLKALPVDLLIPPWPIAITTLKNRTRQPRGTTVHRMCARGCGAASETSVEWKVSVITA
jgi:hypothetical protein